MEAVDRDNSIDVSSNQVPERLQGCPVNTRSSVAYNYRNLKRVLLSSEEKNWLFREVEGLNGLREDQICTKKGLIRRYKLHKNFFYNNKNSYTANGTTKERGRWAMASKPSQLKAIKEELTVMRSNLDECSYNNLRHLISEQDRVDKRKRGIIHPEDDGKLVSHEVANGFIKRHKLDVGTKQACKDASVKACKCPLMSYMWYLICYTLSATLQACCKWNADASTFVFDYAATCGKYHKKTIRLMHTEEYEYISDDSVRVKATQKGKSKSSTSDRLPFAIKVMHMINASGETAPFVVILALKGMSDEEWHVEEVLGLALSNHIGAKGYIYFSRTRCGTKAMWKDYFCRVVIPTIKESNALHKPVNADGSPMRNFFSTDGEDIIISNAYEDEVRGWFDAVLTDYGRVGAGLTGIHNACDRQYTFRGVTRFIRSFLSKGVVVLNRQLESGIRASFDRFMSTYPSVLFGCGLRDNYVQGLLVLCHAFDNVMTRNVVAAGFACCGQDCPPDENGVTVDFEKMMYQCYTDISEEQMELMKRAVPTLSEFVKLRGTVTYPEMIAQGISPGLTSINRDDLTHIRHWSEIVSHESVVARYREEMASRDPAERKRRAAELTLMREEDRCAKAVRVQEERRRKKAANIIAKEKEKQRLALLSAAEKVAERKAKQAAKTTLRAEKEEVRMKQVNDAHHVLSNLTITR